MSKKVSESLSELLQHVEIQDEVLYDLERQVELVKRLESEVEHYRAEVESGDFADKSGDPLQEFVLEESV